MVDQEALKKIWVIALPALAIILLNYVHSLINPSNVEFDWEGEGISYRKQNRIYLLIRDILILILYFVWDPILRKSNKR